MLSYRHGFHAGNHADVLKHWVLMLCLEHLIQKEKAVYYMDTHAGAGRYDLGSEFALKTAEFAQGIGKLWGMFDTLPESLQRYLKLVQQLNSNTGLRHYPGSPWLASHLLRPQDRLRLMELHSTEIPALRRCFSGDKRVQLFELDGFQQLLALLPPPSRRGLVLIDPSYERSAEYGQTSNCLQQALRRFATGVYLIWYPMLTPTKTQALVERLQASVDGDWLNVQLMVHSPSAARGMYGSGLFVVNPPWLLRSQLEAELPTLVSLLGLDSDAGMKIEGKQQHEH